MAFAQSLTAIIVFWAVVGGLGASLLLPAMQSLIHGNFEGAAQKRAYALVGASAAVAAAAGPLLGGFVTTYLSWRVGFLFEVAVIAVVLSGIRLMHDVPYTGSRRIDVVGGRRVPKPSPISIAVGDPPICLAISPLGQIRWPAHKAGQTRDGPTAGAAGGRIVSAGRRAA